MFFKMHKEGVIGYKDLTDADLGRSESTNQTHIGLFGDVLQFLPNNTIIMDALVIYDDQYYVLPVYFDRIKRANGTYDSPKIRTGDLDTSVVRFIRNKANDFAPSTKWFLFWFGLESERPVFFLFNNESDTYNHIISMNVPLRDGVKGRLNNDDPCFSELHNYVLRIVDSSTELLQEEIETVVQIGSTGSRAQVRNIEFEAAVAAISEIGKKGEKIINNYLSLLKEQGDILDYVWENENEEKGYPYDFYYIKNNGSKVYLDVKSTNRRFGQKMVFSSQESDFVSGLSEDYEIFRVFKDRDGRYKLKICCDSKPVFNYISKEIYSHKQRLFNYATFVGGKYAIDPNLVFIHFDSPIDLPEMLE